MEFMTGFKARVQTQHPRVTFVDVRDDGEWYELKRHFFGIFDLNLVAAYFSYDIHGLLLMHPDARIQMQSIEWITMHAGICSFTMTFWYSV